MPSRPPAHKRAPARSRPSRRLTMAQRRRRALRLGAVVLVVIAAGVAALIIRPSSPGAPAQPKPVHFTVGVARCTFVDTTRTTLDYATTPPTAKKNRILVTEIRYPTVSGRGTETANAAPARGHGPFPLVVFGHGFALTPDTYAKLLDSWVRAGFVVAAPLFPDTNQQAVAALPAANSFLAEADDASQPADMAFVARSVEASSAGTQPGCRTVRKLVRQKVALAGQSDGATTAVAAGFDPHYEVKGFSPVAVVDLSGELFGANSSSPDTLVATAKSPALFVSQSATDTCNPPQFSRAIYDGVHTSRKWFLMIRDAHHLPPYIGTDAKAFAVVVASTTAFLADVFAGRTPGRALLRVGNAHPGVATLTHGATAPAIAPLSLGPSTCYLTH